MTKKNQIQINNDEEIFLDLNHLQIQINNDEEINLELIKKSFSNHSKGWLSDLHPIAGLNKQKITYSFEFCDLVFDELKKNKKTARASEIIKTIKEKKTSFQEKKEDLKDAEDVVDSLAYAFEVKNQ